MDLNGFIRHDRNMFAPYCPRHDAHVLLGYESVVAVEPTPSGPKILLHCHCGELLAHDAEPAAQTVVRGHIAPQLERDHVAAAACVCAC